MTDQKLNRGLTTSGSIFLLLVIIAAPAIILAINASSSIISSDTMSGNLLAAHAQGFGNTGCASCHLQPIAADCADCHDAPPTEIDDINFPHHDAASGGPLDDCNTCHGAGDARYAETPDFNHDYCTSCHALAHMERARIGQP